MINSVIEKQSCTSAMLISLLSLSEKESLTPSAISGDVRDQHGPVAGATVRLKGEPSGVLTDRTGRFRLPRGFMSLRTAQPADLVTQYPAQPRTELFRLAQSAELAPSVNERLLRQFQKNVQ